MASAETIAKALGGRKAGSGWTALCPAHDDRKPSLSIGESPDGKMLVRCHSGCDQECVIRALQSRGLWKESRFHQFAHPGSRNQTKRQPDRADAIRTRGALAIWQSALPAKGTLVETYLALRGLRLLPPDALRFHPGLKHPSGGIWPAMVALVTSGADGTPLAIHRTFLARDGNGRAPIDPQKMMLGPCRGGVVSLGNPNAVLMVGEGIETWLAAMLATGRPVWAALSTSGLRALDLPKNARNVIVLADGDEPGEAVKGKLSGARSACAALRRRVLRCRNRIKNLATNAGSVSPSTDEIIENVPWRGYRLNPDRVRIVSLSELRRRE